MSAQGNAAPIIIKKKKVMGGEGHHGGAWKVAYADFVTAMMAFFLLMWLLNATTETQRKGLADYFSPSIPVSRVSGGGDGDFGGESVFAEENLPQDGSGATSERVTEAQKSRGASGVSAKDAPDTLAPPSESQEAEAMKQAFDEALKGLTGESMVEPALKRHIITRVTDQGLVVELFDLEGAPLFVPGEAAPTELLLRLTEVVAELSGLVTNGVASEAHVRAAALPFRDRPVWTLSAARAQELRQLLEDGGLDSARIKRVTGHGDRSPVARNPMALRNNRVEIVFLRTQRREVAQDGAALSPE
ncbi:flagellar motor protein MotB [Roseovarius sp. C7]|uniref:flagellar motor protein MotB n=1 Tax=Roseovarius sp. C7 TaxID=3398643 RepID=UPI0039F6E04F